MTELAKRSTVKIGALEVEGFMLPDGSYRMAQNQAASAIREDPVYALRFLRSKDSKPLLGEGFTDYKPESIEIQTDTSKRGQSRINALPLEVVSAYWLYRAHKGNKDALLLTWALLVEALECRFDEAFGISRSTNERNERLTSNLQQLETYLEESMNYEAEARFEVQFYRDWLFQKGYDPDNLPAIDDDN